MEFRVTVLKEENDQKGMIISPDEISAILYNSNIINIGHANTNSNIELKIIGKVISNLDEDKNQLSGKLGMETLFNNNKSGNELGGGLNKDMSGVQSLVDTAFKDISTYGIESLYEHNKNNIINLTNWGFSFKEETDYRKVIVEVDLGSEKVLTLEFNDMYITSFTQGFGIEKGYGEFEIILSQKEYNGKSVEIS